ncbi:uncharacterized protein LOC142612260 [Castanea sativa]|uniref:uncharacterized protein LOC142612260 n=1 Tax=Castanea sativa TaxID=21020 RepID=UPI003F649E2F
MWPLKLHPKSSGKDFNVSHKSSQVPGLIRVNNGGGLVLYWKNSVEIDIESSSVNHIDVIVNRHSGEPWRFTGFYGEPETHRRQESWDLLRSLHGRNSLPWLCARDFNEIIKQSEKLGGRLRPYAQMQIFREALDECELTDLGFKGFPYTWSKHYRNGVSIWEWLDKPVASFEWFSKFPGSRVHHIDSTTSYHKIMWLELSDLDFQEKKKVFCFEEMWLADKGYGELVERIWQANYDVVDEKMVLIKLDTCSKELTRWSKECFGNISTN